MQDTNTAVIKGAGDLASGVAHRLWYAGFDVIMLELPEPLVVRRTVAFATAVLKGNAEIEGVCARLCPDPSEVADLLTQRIIPVIVDPQGETVAAVQPMMVVDAIMAKRNCGTRINDASFVVGLGPGFTAGQDVHAVIETKRGHTLGKVIYQGSAAPDSGVPGEIQGVSAKRLLRSPADGKLKPLKDIGELVSAGEVVALVEGLEVKAEISGLLRGMVFPGLNVKKGMKIGDVDPRVDVDYHTISDKARAIAGGVLEAFLHLQYTRTNNV